MGGPGQEGVQLFRVASHGADIKDLLDLILEGNMGGWERAPKAQAKGFKGLG